MLVDLIIYDQQIIQRVLQSSLNFFNFTQANLFQLPMQAQIYDPIEIDSVVDQNQKNRDLFDQLLEQNYAPARPIQSFSLHISPPVQTQDKRQIQGCKCTKIDCLKLYCECFARGQICSENCICICCRNKPQNESQIFQAQRVANYRNPGFFKNVPAFVPLRKCTCKKSHCRKKYCECFSAGLKCSEQCECLGCQNGKCQHRDNHTIYQVGISVHA